MAQVEVEEQIGREEGENEVEVDKNYEGFKRGIMKSSMRPTNFVL